MLVFVEEIQVPSPGRQWQAAVPAAAARALEIQLETGDSRFPGPGPDPKRLESRRNHNAAIA